MKKVVIIGAGIGGIATASYLAKAGYEVDVYDKLNKAGGKAGVLDKDGFHFDTGPSWYLMPEVFERYFELMGTSVDEQLDLVALDTAYKVFFPDGDPIVITSNQQQNQETFEKIEKGAGLQLQKYAAQSAEVYDLALKHFLYTNFQTFREFIKPEIILKGIRLGRLALTTYDKEVSRFFKDSRLKRVLEYSAVFLGSSPFETSGIYTLMAALDYRDGVFYPKGGIYRLVQAMQQVSEAHGVKYHFSSPVASINSLDGLATGITLESGEIIPADYVVSNADVHHTETKLLKKQDQTHGEAYWSKRNPGPSALMMYLGVKGKLDTLEHHDLLFVKEWRENFEAIYHQKIAPHPASIYISKATATDPSFAPEGHEALVVLVPFPAGVYPDEVECEELAATYLDDIVKMTGIVDLKERIVSKTIMSPHEYRDMYNSWQGGALGPAHTLMQTAIFRTSNTSRKLRNLYYVGGSTIPGIGMPMVIISAEQAYKRIVGIKKGGLVAAIEKVTS